MTEPYERVAVIGAGAWGTALALVAARAGRRVVLWAREAEVLAAIRTAGENTPFLPGTPLPQSIAPTGQLASAAEGADAVLLATPAQHMRAVLTDLAPHLRAAAPLVLCAKGIERGSGKLLTEIVAETAPQVAPAILSGPSFARDVARDLPTAVTIAAQGEVGFRLLATLGHSSFRPYASEDLTGVALGGSAKNVYAIGCGIVAGLGLGENARAALLTRSFAELVRLGLAMGAKHETLMGLSGLGDLVLTATSKSSRNFTFGYEFAERRVDLRGADHPLAEGVDTAAALVARAKRHGVELPVAETIADILSGTLALPAQADGATVQVGIGENTRWLIGCSKASRKPGHGRRRKKRAPRANHGTASAISPPPII
jgi:glycerol-3-phosphate dehydrogenase (NAD(P)+)